MSSRREVCLSIPALAALSLLMDKRAGAQQAEHVDGAVANHLPSGTALMRDNTIFYAAKLPIKASAVGSSQAVTHGTLPTGEGVELHNSTLLAGHEPHPPHRHEHEEFIFMREGEVDWLIDGKREPAGPGDILYAASNVLHGMRNTGSTTAKYFVLAIGPNLKSA